MAKSNMLSTREFRTNGEKDKKRETKVTLRYNRYQGVYLLLQLRTFLSIIQLGRVIGAFQRLIPLHCQTKN